MPVINLLPGGGYSTAVVYNQSSDLANTYYINPSGSADDSTALNSIMNAAGKRLILGSGTFRLRSTLQVLFNGITIEGSGTGATSLVIDDSLGNIGDGILIKNTYDCRVKNLTIASVSARTAGNGIHVTGGDPTLTLTGFPLRDAGVLIEDVDMTTQYNGILVDSDEVNNYQNWRTYIRGGMHRNGGNGGVGIWINTSPGTSRSGASHFIENYYFARTPGASVAGIRLSGTGDVTLLNNEVYGANYGLLIDPIASAVQQVTNVIGGFYDTSNNACLRIAPNASAVNFGAFRFVDVWFGTSPNAVEIVGAAAKWIRFQGCYLYNATSGWCGLIDTASNVDFNGCNISSGTSGGLKFTNNASRFSVQGCRFSLNDYGGGAANLPIGIQIDAGSDHYTVTGNDISDAGIATKITNTPGLAAAQRIVQDNVTA